MPVVTGLTPLLAADSPLGPHARALVEDLFRREHEAAFDLPTDDPLDPGRRRRVELTLPEILEQPEVIRQTLEREREAVRSAARELAGAGLERIVLTGCGDSLAVMVGVRALFETLTGVPCEPVQALDLAYYYNRPIGPRTLVITLSSSGTTTRTVEAMLIARARGARSLALTNTPGSALMVEADHAILVHARRRGWPTQASTAAMALLAQLAIDMAGAGERGEAGERSPGRLQAALDAAPDAIANTIERHDAAIAALAARQAERAMYLFAAGGPSYASALFGAAKVKECTPNHAIAIPLEEFHHYNSQKRGDPLFLVAPEGPSVPRARDTAAQGRRWGGSIHSVVTEGDETLTELSDTVLRLPPLPEVIAPLVYSVPVQLFAYHLAMAQFRLAEDGIVAHLVAGPPLQRALHGASADLGGRLSPRLTMARLLTTARSWWRRRAGYLARLHGRQGHPEPLAHKRRYDVPALEGNRAERNCAFLAGRELAAKVSDDERIRRPSPREYFREPPQGGHDQHPLRWCLLHEKERGRPVQVSGVRPSP